MPLHRGVSHQLRQEVVVEVLGLEQRLDDERLLSAREVVEGVGRRLIGEPVGAGGPVDDLLDRPLGVGAGKVGADRALKSWTSSSRRPSGSSSGLGGGPPPSPPNGRSASGASAPSEMDPGLVWRIA